MNIFISIQTKKLYQVFFFLKECIHLKTECFQISLVMALGLTKGEVNMFNDSFTFFFLSQYSFCFFPSWIEESRPWIPNHCTLNEKSEAWHTWGSISFGGLKGEVLLMGGEWWEEDWVSLDDLGTNTLWFFFFLILLVFFFIFSSLTSLSGLWQII